MHNEDRAFWEFLRMLEEICGVQFHRVYNLSKIAATLKGKFGFFSDRGGWCAKVHSLTESDTNEAT